MAFGQQNYNYPYFNAPGYGTTPFYQPPQATQTVQNNGAGIIWVQGEAGAKAYPVAPNTSLLLMDSENKTMYLKSADASGMPAMRVFDYNERTATPPVNTSDYVTREEFGKLASIVESMKGANANE